MIEPDLRLLLESITDMNAYPITIPQNEKDVSIAFRQTGYGRNSDSNLSESNIIDYNFQLSVIGTDLTEVVVKSSSLIDGLENEAGTVNDTNILIIRVVGSVDIFDTIQHNYERAIDIMIKVKK